MPISTSFLNDCSTAVISPFDELEARILDNMYNAYAGRNITVEPISTQSLARSIFLSVYTRSLMMHLGTDILKLGVYRE